MNEPIVKQIKINTPQCSPFAPNQKEWYKHERAHPVHINPLKADSSSSFDQDEDQFFKKIRLRNDAPIPYLGIPTLTSPSSISLSDSDVEKEVYGVMNAHRIVLNEGANFTFSEIKHQQHLQKLLHQERDQFLKQIEERALTSESLKWVQIISTVALFGVALIGAAVSIVTGNVPGVIGAIGAAASAASGVSSGTRGFYNLGTQEIVGAAEENKLRSDLAHNKVTAMLADNQTILAKIHDHERNTAEIEINRSHIRMF